MLCYEPPSCRACDRLVAGIGVQIVVVVLFTGIAASVGISGIPAAPGAVAREMASSFGFIGPAFPEPGGTYCRGRQSGAAPMLISS